MLRGRTRVAAAVGAIAVLALAGAIALSGDDSESFRLVEAAATIECAGSLVQLEFDPDGRIRAGVGGVTLARADASRREVNDDVCSAATTQTGWDTRTPYSRRSGTTTLRCRLPGRFSIHLHPLSPSWAGERPAGSALYLVLGRRVGPGTGPNRTIVASAGVLERPEESELAFAPAYCTPS